MKDAIERIKKGEERLNRAVRALEEVGKALDLYEKAQERVRAVDGYYGSPDWFRDLEDYDAGRLDVPREQLPAGILSEDAAYDMLTDNREMALRMAELAGEILRREE